MEQAARSVSQVHGSFPQPNPQVLVVGIGRQSEPVPWAQVSRGGGAAAHFYIDQTRQYDDFSADWTPTHELSHMLIPLVKSDDRWLSEGLASYYQNVLRARDGRLSERQAWQKLNAGFQRGVKGSRGAPLGEASREMRETRGYMQVYWSGAAILMIADIGLRYKTDGQWNLDKALAEIYRCCMANDHAWRARDLFARLDQITSSSVFMDLYRRQISSSRFPDIFSLYPELGLSQRGNSVRLKSQAPLASIRQSIMGQTSDN